jgi:hypothetical protein
MSRPLTTSHISQAWAQLTKSFSSRSALAIARGALYAGSAWCAERPPHQPAKNPAGQDVTLGLSKVQVSTAMIKSRDDHDVQIVLNAFDTLFNKRDYASASGLRVTSSTAPIFRLAATGCLA